jgi:Mg2+ and Co2+ transporters
MEARLISLAGAASLSMTEIRDAAARDGGTLWLDFDHTDEDSMELLGELIDVRPSDIEECHNRSPVPHGGSVVDQRNCAEQDHEDQQERECEEVECPGERD